MSLLQLVTDTRSKLVLQTNAYFHVLDRLLNELKRRFAATQWGVLRGIQALNLASQTFTDIGTVLVHLLKLMVLT